MDSTHLLHVIFSITNELCIVQNESASKPSEQSLLANEWTFNLFLEKLEQFA